MLFLMGLRGARFQNIFLTNSLQLDKHVWVVYVCVCVYNLYVCVYMKNIYVYAVYS